MNAGDPVTVIRYRFEGTIYSFAYSAWKGKVVERNGILTIDTESEEYTKNLSPAEKKDFENIIPYYNDNSYGNPLLD